mmetsp:Transcript_4474/g.10385  ORF Transcript_4474/g.10385 Transcript_4474/m.10385 type:complete len:118 (-) Transcript_4474:51-404(-)
MLDRPPASEIMGMEAAELGRFSAREPMQPDEDLVGCGPGDLMRSSFGASPALGFGVGPVFSETSASVPTVRPESLDAGRWLRASAWNGPRFFVVSLCRRRARYGQPTAEGPGIAKLM